jgi:tRNA A-37 threonylcarbamoyl transferase component Bud32
MLGIPESKAAVRVLLIIHDFAPRLMNYAKVLDDTNLSILAVDEWVFERDIDKGFLGEALASELIFPYAPLTNGEYLRFQEVRLKKRLIVEMLESLVLDFPELSYLFCIEPEYFMYEAMLTRARLYPPMMYAMASLTEKGVAREKVETVLRGYIQALEKLEQDGIVCSSNDYVRISPDFVAYARRRRVRFISLFKTGQRTLFTSLLGIFPGILNFLSQSKDLSVSLQRMMGPNARFDLQVEDPENHIFVPTSTGLAPLTNRMDIEGFAREVLGADKSTKVSVTSLGGILNDVFLVTTHAKDKEAKVVVKRFRDWSNFKWFPLTLWSVGTKTFAVAGNLRLEREYAINRFLDSKGFAVPKLLNVSPSQRLIVMEYVEGEDLSKMVKCAVSSENTDETEKALSVVSEVGRTFARVHSLGVALGDTKPENILVAKTGKIYLMDFEQASRKGDTVWDIAEFLYYSGHDISPFVDLNRLERFAETFIRGYLEAGGQPDTVKSAGSPKYTKVFSIFTYPHIVYVFSNLCRRADKLKV